MSLIQMSQLDLMDKRVLIRVDFNVPHQNNQIVHDARIRAALPGIRFALERGAGVILMSHRGHPNPPEYTPELSLRHVAEYLSNLLKQPVPLIDDWAAGVNIVPGQVMLCENTRFYPGEMSNDEHLAKAMAKCCDIYVLDAFSVAHRAHASTVGVAKFAPIACAGPLLCAELTALEPVLMHPSAPVVAIVGGAKVSSKLKLLTKLSEKVDYLIIGGGMANTLMAAQGLPIGRSLYEPDLLDEANTLLHYASEQDCKILLPLDVVVTDKITSKPKAEIKAVSDVQASDNIVDIGPETIILYGKCIEQAQTIIWNGPVGIFEIEAFSHGTQALAKKIAESKAYSVAGGGDTIAAIEQCHVTEAISYISTGGGAFLNLLEGSPLAAVKALHDRAMQQLVSSAVKIQD